MKKIVSCISVVACFTSVSLHAASTGMGKIIFTEGHSSPSCREVKHKENDTGIEKTFRIGNVDGDDDMGAVILAAMIANRDVVIYYDESVTSGCGTNPKVGRVRVY